MITQHNVKCEIVYTPEMLYLTRTSGFTFKGLLILDDVWVTHVGEDRHLLTRLLPFFI